MNKKLFSLSSFTGFYFVVVFKRQKLYGVLSVPAVKEFTHIDKKGKSVLASGRYVTLATR